MQIILASASPRRKELLGMICPSFEVVVSTVEEILPSGIAAQDAPEYLARLKACDVAKQHPDALVIGADTSVLIENEILGKPKDADDAKRMLRLLSGAQHQVITGCCLCMGGRVHSFSQTTAVQFYPLSDREIDHYIASGEPFDKAGAYGIQQKGCVLVEGIQGDYFNVVGLPVAKLAREIKDFLNQSAKKETA